VETLLLYLRDLPGVPAHETEYRFAPPRRWRFDLAFPSVYWALEIEGGVWTAGRHTRGQGYTNDIRKYNAAMLLGWRILRVTPAMIASGEAFALLDDWLEVILQG
jgi:hypothetical protein